MVVAMKLAALAAHKAQRLAGGSAITYARGANSVALTAIVGSAESIVANDFGIVIDERHYRDFLVIAAELIVSAAVVLPARGDIITEGTKTYLVTSDGSESHYRYSDRFEQVLRIHTVEKVTP